MFLSQLEKSLRMTRRLSQLLSQDGLENDCSELIQHGSCLRMIQSNDGRVELLVVSAVGDTKQLHQNHEDGRGEEQFVLFQFDCDSFLLVTRVP